MPFDLQSAQVAVGVVIGIITILGKIFGLFGKPWHWVASLFKPKPLVGRKRPVNTVSTVR